MTHTELIINIVSCLATVTATVLQLYRRPTNRSGDEAAEKDRRPASPPADATNDTGTAG